MLITVLHLQAVLERSRRQFETLRRRNFAGIFRDVLSTNDPARCMAACQSYAANERNAAIASPIRGPGPAAARLRSGRLTVGRRYYQLFGFFLQICIRMCSKIPSKFMFAILRAHKLYVSFTVFQEQRLEQFGLSIIRTMENSILRRQL